MAREWEKEFAAIERRREDVQAARKTWMARCTEATEKFRRDEAEYRGAVDAALLAGEEPPAPLDADAYMVPGRLETFQSEFDRLDADATRLFAQYAPKIRADLDSKAERIWQRVAPIVRQLERAAEELEELRQQHRRIDLATDTPATVWRSQPITADMLLDTSDADAFVPPSPRIDVLSGGSTTAAVAAQTTENWSL
jgi:hypothetical protein